METEQMVDLTHGTGVPNTPNDPVDPKPITDAIKTSEKAAAIEAAEVEAKAAKATAKATKAMAKVSAEAEAAVTVAAPAIVIPKAADGPDPFNIDDLVLTQSFAEAIDAEEVINTISIKKPNKQEWFRVHPHSSYLSKSKPIRNTTSCIPT
jgi:hypothetical protein